MKTNTLTMECNIDAGLFRKFALFDAFCHQRRWLLPVGFFAIMAVCACLCFVKQGTLLGSVLLGVGLLLPATYVLSYDLSVREQIKKLGLQRPRYAYTVVLYRSTGVEVSTPQEKVICAWENVYRVYRLKGCVYLYVTPKKAYLLPTDQIRGGEKKLWTLLGDVLPAGKLRSWGK